ncbi:NUDIX hydrolase [Halalkalibacillus halophilus]|uniref:NUDIX hydrolase n=1 Tax=Halalkalibacillus halophilus TaxID=392827 RepID=UPI0004251B5A|nr:NUDIX hydrolase [Halalkalibacillus halophilus]
MDHEHQSVVVLAKKKDDFILIRQFRKPVDTYVIQLPGGGLEANESLAEGARREFYEETGYTCGKLDYVGELLPASWISKEITHVFYTSDVLDQKEQQLENHEDIEVVEVSVESCLEKIKQSEYNDSELCYAVLQGLLQGYIK